MKKPKTQSRPVTPPRLADLTETDLKWATGGNNFINFKADNDLAASNNFINF